MTTTYRIHYTVLYLRGSAFGIETFEGTFGELVQHVYKGQVRGVIDKITEGADEFEYDDGIIDWTGCVAQKCCQLAWAQVDQYGDAGRPTKWLCDFIEAHSSIAPPRPADETILDWTP